MKDTDHEENADPRKDRICQWECLKAYVKTEIPHIKHPDNHQPNTLANSCGKRIQYIHGWGDPFCQAVITIPGLVGFLDLLSKESENGLGRVAGLKPRKERMRV
jgi:hypothetical protein